MATPSGADTDESEGWSGSWDTTAEGDGTVELRATATEPSGAESDSLLVVVDNTAPVVSVRMTPGLFSPNGDGRLDRTSARISVNEASTLTVRVADARG